MPNTTFLITPVGDDLSMIPDSTFSNLQLEGRLAGSSLDSATDWLFNLKKICVVEKSESNCWRGLYSTTYGIDDHSAYSSPVTELTAEGLKTIPVNPHSYSLVSDPLNTGAAPNQITGSKLGTFFHHKGSWYSGFDGDWGELPLSEVTLQYPNLKLSADSSFEGYIKKEIRAIERFYPNNFGQGDANECRCSGCVLPEPIRDYADVSAGSLYSSSKTYFVYTMSAPALLSFSFSGGLVGSITVSSNTGQSSTVSKPKKNESVSGTLLVAKNAESITVSIQGSNTNTSGTVYSSYIVSCGTDSGPP